MRCDIIMLHGTRLKVNYGELNRERKDERNVIKRMRYALGEYVSLHYVKYMRRVAESRELL